MKKSILFILLLLNLFYLHNLNASMLLGDKGICIEDFWLHNENFYYVKSEDNETYYSRTTDYALSVRSGYIYLNDDDNDDICKPEPYLILGMDVKDWHFLNALTGLLFGFVFMIFTIYIFINVGKEK